MVTHKVTSWKKETFISLWKSAHWTNKEFFVTWTNTSTLWQSILISPSCPLKHCFHSSISYHYELHHYYYSCEQTVSADFQFVHFFIVRTRVVTSKVLRCQKRNWKFLLFKSVIMPLFVIQNPKLSILFSNYCLKWN